MGIEKPQILKHASPIATFVDYLCEPDFGFEFVPPYHIDLEVLNESHYSRYARPGLPSSSSRYSPRQLSNKSSTTKSEQLSQQLPGGTYNFTRHTHPEGRPYFQHDKLVTCDDMQDSTIHEFTWQALSIICYMLKEMKESDANFKFHQEVEFCIELEALTSPPEFNYYLVDHEKQKIFWANKIQPAEIAGAEDFVRENMLREEYWKHVEYYPCHRHTATQDYEELKQLLAACATDGSTSEGSTSPMSAKAIELHLKVLKSFGDQQSTSKTWAIARLFGLFIRGQVVNKCGSQNARLDRFASLEETPAKFQGEYALINSHFTMGFGDRHLKRCAKTWADRIAYSESWRGYKRHYINEWKEIRHLNCVLLLASLHIPSHTHTLLKLILQRGAIITALISAILSYYLSTELENTGDHASDAAAYFQQREELSYGVQRLALWNSAPQASLVWGTGLFMLYILL